MKKLTKIIVVIMIAVFALSVLACGEPGKVTLVVVGNDTKTYTVDTTGKGLSTLKDLMDYLVENEDFVYEESAGMLLSANGKTANPPEYWFLYTDLSIEGIDYFDNSWGTSEFNGKTYGSATKGISELPLSKGATYLIECAEYSWQ